MQKLDSSLTEDYWYAQTRVPTIVAIESDPRKFMLTENGYMQKAAIRAATYWKQRKQYFGDRWLLPMTQTGSGALSKTDIEVLRKGYIVIVTLLSGLQVAMVDPSRLEGRDPQEARERCIFYLTTVEANERSFRSGLEIMFLLSSYGLASERQLELTNMLYTALPTKIGHISIFQRNSEGRRELLDFLAFRLEMTYAMYSSTQVSVVSVGSRQDVLAALEARGIHRRYVPRQLGGDYDYSQLSGWVQKRLIVENAMGAALPHNRRLSKLAYRNCKRLSGSRMCQEPQMLLKRVQDKDTYARKKERKVRRKLCFARYRILAGKGGARGRGTRDTLVNALILSSRAEGRKHTA